MESIIDHYIFVFGKVIWLLGKQETEESVVMFYHMDMDCFIWLKEKSYLISFLVELFLLLVLVFRKGLLCKK